MPEDQPGRQVALDQYRSHRAVLGAQLLVHAHEVGLDRGVVQAVQALGGTDVCRAAWRRSQVVIGGALGGVGGHRVSEVWAEERR